MTKAIRATAIGLGGIALALAVLGGLGCGVSSIHVRLDGETRYQTIDGWETSTRYWEEDKANDRFDSSFEPHVDAIMKFLADEVGINAIRLEVMSGAENPTDYWGRFHSGQMGYVEFAKRRYEKINDNPDPDVVNPAGFQFSLFDYRVETSVLPLRRALAARGERLLINVCYVDFKGNNAAGQTVQGELSHARNPREYAEMILVYLRRLRDKHGLTPDSVEIVLEPENTADWRGRAIGQALVVVADVLRDNGFTPQFLAPSNTSMANAIEYFDEMIQVPGVLDRLNTFVYHRYRRQRTADVERIWSRAQAHGLKTAMLEKLKAGIDILLEDLTVGHVSSWQQWGPAARLAGGDNGHVYALVDMSAPERPPIVRSRLSNELAHVFRYVRNGAVRIDSRTSPSSQKSAAFINRDGTWVVVVRPQRAAELSIEGLPAGNYGVRFTADGGAFGDERTVTVPADGTWTTTIPSGGVLTIHGLLSAAERR